MPRYYSLIIFILLFSSCASKSANDFISPTLTANSVNNNVKEADLYLLYALDAQYMGNNQLAAKYFEKLYDVYEDVIYIKEAIRNRILLKEYSQIKKLLDKSLANHPNDSELKRFQAAYFLDMGKFKEAESILKSLIALENKETDKAFLAKTQLGLGQREKALSFYEDAYKKDHNTQSLIQLVDIYYFSLGEKEKAIQLLQTHMDFVGCEEEVCYKLLEIYQKEKDLNGLVKTAKKLHEKTGKHEFAEMILEIYSYQKEYDGAIEFLEKSKIDDSALLELYVLKKRFKKALALASKLYNETQDLHFLAQLAMIEYESNEDKKDPAMLQSVQKKFDKVVATLDVPTYNNFYGYILIDHEIDVEKGMNLIERALKKLPNAPYFIDSLAWGHYKNGACQKAYDTIYPIMIMVNEPEIQEHYETIKACKEGK